jgi:rhodanese-related sulfurtransferase
MSVEALAQRMQAGGVLLVDVRSADEFARGCATLAYILLISCVSCLTHALSDACLAR